MQSVGGENMIKLKFKVYLTTLNVNVECMKIIILKVCIFYHTSPLETFLIGGNKMTQNSAVIYKCSFES